MMHQRAPDTLTAAAEVLDAQRLDLREDGGGPRHFLKGRAVHASTMLDLLSFDDHGKAQWTRGRYEWSFERGEEPEFYVDLGLIRPPRDADDDPRAFHAILRLHPWAQFRWPPREA